ncbi:MAG: hypothetical protein FWG75_07390 [Cystobacterineae bacterium]|nr:hypothetical protein [Cystobacterineae bacterium]
MSENRFFDKRCAKHYISTGVLSPEAFQQHLEALPDLFEKACPIEASMDEEAPMEIPETPQAAPPEIPPAETP